MPVAETTNPTEVADGQYASVLSVCRRRADERRGFLDELGLALTARRRMALSDRDRTLILGILHGLVADVDLVLRRTLLDRARARGSSVADPVAIALAGLTVRMLDDRITSSGLFEDRDLIEAAYNRLIQHKLEHAVASRGAGPWAAAEARPGGRFIESLQRTADVRLGDAIDAHMVDRSRRFDTYANPRLPVRDAPVRSAERLVWSAAALLQSVLPADVAGEPADTETLIETAVLEALDVEGVGEPARAPTAYLADQIIRRQPVTAETLFNLLADGEVTLFEALMSRLSGLSALTFRRLFYERSGEGLAVVARAIDLDRESYASLRELVTRALDAPAVNDDTAAGLALYDALTEAMAAQIVRHWRRPKGLLEAQRRLAASRDAARE